MSENIEIIESDDYISISNKIMTLSINKNTGCLEISDFSEKLYLIDGYILFNTDLGTFSTKDSPILNVNLNSDFDSINLTIKYIIDDYDVSLIISAIEQQKFMTLQVRINNKSSNDLRFKNLKIIFDIKTEQPLWGLKNGFGSWDLTKPEKIKNALFESYWYTVIYEKENYGIVSGFTSFEDFIFKFNIENTKFVPEIILDNFKVEPSKYIELPAIYFRIGKVSEILQEYTKYVQEKNKIKILPRIPTGWCSWYYYYTFVSYDDVINNTEFSRKYFGDSFEYIQIDDGYQVAVGDWIPNERFAKGLDNLVKEINKFGYKAGIWIAPFIAIEDSQLFKEHHDWFIKDTKGNPKKVGYNPLWNSNIYALDLTHPQVQNWLYETFARFRSYGFEYFKIDFLYHAMAEGKRYAEIPRGKAFQNALSIIRRAVGNSLILGCGAPLGTSLKYVDAMRIGNDVAPTWKLDWGGGIYQPALNTVFRCYLNNTWWLNDPDCVLVRQEDSDLSDDEVIFWLTIVAISGGLVIDSDNLEEVSKTRINLLQRILPPIKANPTTIIKNQDHPEIFYFKIGPTENITILGLLNFEDDIKTITLDFEEINIKNIVHVSDFWNMTYVGNFKEHITCEIKPHSAKLLILKEKSGRPDVIVSNGHFAQKDMIDTCWNEHTKTLEVQDSSRSNEFLIAVPKTYRIVNEIGEMVFDDDEFKIYKINLGHVKGNMFKFEKVRV